MSPDEDLEVRQRLRDVGMRRSEAIRAARAASEELNVVVRRANELGSSITEIATDSGLSRQAVYNVLRRRD